MGPRFYWVSKGAICALVLLLTGCGSALFEGIDLNLILSLSQGKTRNIFLPKNVKSGESISYQVTLPPAHGKLEGAPPEFTYVPDASYVGNDLVLLKLTAGDPAESAVMTIQFIVLDVNEPPIAKSFTVVGEEDSDIAVTLSATDPEKADLSYAIIDPPRHGSLSGTPPQVFYRGQTNYFGSDSFTFRAHDGELSSGVTTIFIDVRAVNDAPVASPQSIVMDEDTQKSISLTGVDIDSTDLSFSITTLPQHGTLSGTGANLTYAPAANFHGSDVFTYRVTDGAGASSQADITLGIRQVNDSPVASAQTLALDEDTTFAITLAANDVDGDPLAYSIVTSPTHGTLSGTPPAVVYRPNVNFNGFDQFSFKANDGQVDSMPATVALAVRAINDPPVAQAQSLSVAEDGSLPITLSATDVESSPLSFSIVNAPTHGTLSGTPPAVTYRPNANYFGADSFTFKANDGTLDSAAVTVTLTVTAVNDAPVAQNFQLTTDEDTPVQQALAANDIDNETLVFEIVSAPSHGTAQVIGNQVRYVPAANYHGADSFTFRASDNQLASNVATGSVTVRSINDLPVGTAQALTNYDGLRIEGQLAATDADSDALTFRITRQPAGTITSNAAGVFTYHPPLNGAADSFGFVANDGTSDGAETNVAISAYESRWPGARFLQTGTRDMGARREVGVLTDASGNIYVAGSSTRLFDGVTLASGVAAIYLVKYGPLGNLIWRRNFYTNSLQDFRAKGVVFGPDQKLWVYGYCNNQGPITMPGPETGIVVKFDPSNATEPTYATGNFGDVSFKVRYDNILKDESGNPYVVVAEVFDGVSSTWFRFSTHTLNQDGSLGTLVAHSKVLCVDRGAFYYSDGFALIKKSIATGDVAWSRPVLAQPFYHGDYLLAVRTDKDGNLFVTGDHRISNNFDSQLFLAKVNPQTGENVFATLATPVPSQGIYGDQIEFDDYGRIIVFGAMVATFGRPWFARFNAAGALEASAALGYSYGNAAFSKDVHAGAVLPNGDMFGVVERSTANDFNLEKYRRDGTRLGVGL